MTEKIAVLYNDSCPICAREVGAYRRYAEARDLPVRFDGLGRADLARWGVDAEAAARRLHVLHEGRVVAGVDAFILLWREMPRFRWLARLTALPVVRHVAGLVYERALAPLLYAMHRRRVRRHGDACAAGGGR